MASDNMHFRDPIMYCIIKLRITVPALHGNGVYSMYGLLPMVRECHSLEGVTHPDMHFEFVPTARSKRVLCQELCE